MFNTLNFPANVYTKSGAAVKLLASDGTYVFGFINGAPDAWYHDGWSIGGHSNNNLEMPISIADELAKVPGEYLEALTAFHLAGRKITGIKYLRKVQIDAGRAYGLTICKQMYEEYVSKHPNFKTW